MKTLGKNSSYLKYLKESHYILKSQRYSQLFLKKRSLKSWKTICISYNTNMDVCIHTHTHTHTHIYIYTCMGFPGGTSDKESTCSIPGLQRCPGGGHGNSLQYSCLENPMNRGAWRYVHRVAKSQKRLKQLSMEACVYNKVEGYISQH